jgi:transmembrane sensor
MDAMKTREEREARSVGEQAAEWLLILEENRPQDRDAFSEWIAKSPLHIGAFLRAAAMDTLLSRVDPQRTVDIERHTATDEVRDIDSSSAHMETRPNRSWRISKRWAAAACIGIVTLMPAVWWHATNGDRANLQHFDTGVGEQRALELDDGSLLHLNTNSKVTVRFTGQERRVDLLAGEALFRIQRDSSRPFRVHSGRIVIQAVGTQFNVYRRLDDAVVSVLEGAVQISDERNLSGQSPTRIRLNAGEEAQVAYNGSLSKKTLPDVSRVSAWRQRRLIFRDEPLSNIASEFNRYNRTPKIRIEGADIGARRYAAAFDADDPESLLGILGKDRTLRVEQRADELIIRPEPKSGD